MSRRGTCFSRRSISRRINVVVKVVVVPRDVARLLGAVLLHTIFGDHAILNHLATLRVDGVRDVGVEFDARVALGPGGEARELAAAVVAELGAEVVLAAAAGAALADLA